MNDQIPILTHDDFVKIMVDSCPELESKILDFIARENLQIIGSISDNEIKIEESSGQVYFGYKDWPYFTYFTHGVIAGIQFINYMSEHLPDNEKEAVSSVVIPMLQWGILRDDNAQRPVLPAELRELDQVFEKASIDLSTLAIGFTLLHELGHSYHDHILEQLRELRDMELEADDYAMTQLISSIGSYTSQEYPDVDDALSKVTYKRSTAVGLLLVWMLFEETRNGGWNSTSDHPPVALRLKRFIDFISNPETKEELCATLYLPLSIGKKFKLDEDFQPANAVEVMNRILDDHIPTDYGR